MPVIPGLRIANYSGRLDDDEQRAREAEEFSLLEGAGQFGLSTLGMAGAIFDTPATALRNVAAGEMPWRHLWPGDADKRIYGKDVWKAWGVEDPGFASELALEMILDPLMYLSGGMAAVTRGSKAGKALVKSGVLTGARDIENIGRKKALHVLKRIRNEAVNPAGGVPLPGHKLDELSPLFKDFDFLKKSAESTITNRATNKLAPLFGQHEEKYLDKLIRLGLDAESTGARSKIGQRQLKRMLTPQDVLEYNANPDARKKLVEYLVRKKQLPGNVPWAKQHLPFAKQLGDPLAPHMTFGGGLAKPFIYPFNRKGYFNINNERLMRMGDRLGDATRWSWPGVALASKFSKSTFGAKTPEVQRMADEIQKATRSARERATETVLDVSREVPLYKDASLGYSQKVTPEVMRDWFEVPGYNNLEIGKNRAGLATKHGLSPADVALLNKHAKTVRSGLDKSFDAMREVGFDLPYLRDEWVSYHPRDLVKAAWSKDAGNIVVDPVSEFLKQAPFTESRASIFRKVEGGTGRINEIYADVELNQLLSAMDNVYEKGADLSALLSTSFRGKIAGARWAQNTLKRKLKTEGTKSAQDFVFARMNEGFEKSLWEQYGKYFHNAEHTPPKRIPRFMAGSTKDKGAPGHVLGFAAQMRQSTKEQRLAGIFGHHPLADLENAQELVADAVGSRRLVLGILARHASPSTGTIGHEVQPAGVSLRKALGDLKIDTDVFDDATGQIKLQPGPKGTSIERSTKHLVNLRDEIFSRTLPGRVPKGSPISTADDLRGLLDGWVVPHHIAEDLERTLSFTMNPGSSKMTDLWDGYLTLTKTHLTTPHPAFAGRNWISGQVRNMMIGLFSRKSRKFARQLMSGDTVKGAAEIPGMATEISKRGLGSLSDKNATTVLQEWVATHKLMPEEAYGYDVINNRMSRTANTILKEGVEPLRQPTAFVPLEKPRLGKMFKMWLGLDEVAAARRKELNRWYIPGRDFFEVEGAYQRGGGRKLETHFNPARAGKLVNQWVEGDNRVSPFIKALMDGWDPSSAARRVMDAQVDYESRNFTRFERSVMQRIFPFYKFRSGQMKWLPQELSQRPGGPIPQTIRAINLARGDREKFMPEHMLAGAAVPLSPDIPGLKPPDPSTDISAQFTGLMFADPLDITPGISSSATQGILSATHPLMKGIAEVGLDTSFFQSGRRLGDIKSPLSKLLENIKGTPYKDRYPGPEDIGKVWGSEPSKAIEHLLVTNTPIARYVNTLSQLFEPRVQIKEGDYAGLLGKTLPKLVGLPHVARVSKRQRDALKRVRAEQLLKERGKAKAFERTYIPQEQLLEIARIHGPERAQQLLRYQNVLNRLAKELREAKIRSLGGSETARMQRRELQEQIDRLKESVGVSQ